MNLFAGRDWISQPFMAPAGFPDNGIWFVAGLAIAGFLMIVWAVSSGR